MWTVNENCNRQDVWWRKYQFFAQDSRIRPRIEKIKERATNAFRYNSSYAPFLLSRVLRQARSPILRHLKMSSSSNIGRRPESTISSFDSDRSTRSAISALVAHIQEAAKVLEDHYSTSSTDENPSGVPSMHHAEEHPLDKKIMKREVRAAVQTIEGACAQLVDTVGNPHHILMNVWLFFCTKISSLSLLNSFRRDSWKCVLDHSGMWYAYSPQCA